MKLELKHLAPYLPYGFKVQHLNKVWQVVGYSMHKENIKQGLIIKEFSSNNYVPFNCVKPILRPLSDLPTLVSNSVLDYLIGFDITKHRILHSHWLFLLKNHFDVFGLIEKGLAIDVNTLEQ